MSAAEHIAPSLRIRIADDRDHNAIISSWLRSYRNGQAPQVRRIPEKEFYHEHQRVVQNLIGHKDADRPRENTVVLVAHDPEDERHLFAWLCAEFLPKELVIHYVFTFPVFRRFGIAKTLFARVMEESEGRPVVASHTSRKVIDHCIIENCNHIGRSQCDIRPGIMSRNGITFNPYRIHT